MCGSQASLLWCILFLRPAPCVQRLRYNHRKYIHCRFCFILQQSWRVCYGESYWENVTTVLQAGKNFLQQSKQLLMQVHRMLLGYRWGPLRKVKYKGEVLILPLPQCYDKLSFVTRRSGIGLDDQIPWKSHRDLDVAHTHTRTNAHILSLIHLLDPIPYVGGTDANPGSKQVSSTFLHSSQ